MLIRSPDRRNAMWNARVLSVALGFCVALGGVVRPALAQCADMDGDGYGIPAAGCSHAEEDCNDHDEGAFPGNPVEDCDGIDNDCDGFIDEDPPCSGVLDFMQKGEDVQLTNPDHWNSRYPEIAWNGSAYGVFWDDGGDSGGYFGIFDAGGEPLIVPQPLFPDRWGVHLQDLVWTGSEYGLVWEDWRDSDGPSIEVYFTRLDPRGQRLMGDVRLTNRISSRVFSTIVWNGLEYGVFRRDDYLAEGEYRTYFVPISAAGVPGEEVFLDIGNDNPPGHRFSTIAHAAVWTGNQYGVAVLKQDLDEFSYYHYLVLLDSSGVKLNTTLVEGNIPSYDLELTWNGSEYAYWWEYQGEVYLTRLQADGSFVNPSDRHVQVTDSTFPYRGGNHLGRVAWSGEEYGLVYRPQIVWPETDYQSRFNRVSAAGVLLDEEITISTEAFNESRVVDVAWSGIGYGLIWEDRKSGLRNLHFNNVADDYDLDGRAGRRDCDDHDPDLWSIPGPVRDLSFAADKQSLTWAEPENTGGTAPVSMYDMLRSSDPADFGAGSAVCIESDDGDTQAIDADLPAPGAVFAYLARGENVCGEGSLGTSGSGLQRPGRVCP
jgi:hypothetical protein